MIQQTVNVIYLKHFGGHFPYAYAVILILSPIFIALFDAWGNKYFLIMLFVLIMHCLV